MTTTRQSPAPKFNNDAYQFSHACQPRGYGCWAFGLDTKTPDMDDVMWASGTLTEAKADVRRRLAEKGVTVTTVFVLP
jgi:hypothetical protein